MQDKFTITVNNCVLKNLDLIFKKKTLRTEYSMYPMLNKNTSPSVNSYNLFTNTLTESFISSSIYSQKLR